MPLLPPVPPGVDGARGWVQAHLGDLVDGPVTASARFRGGQVAADTALAAYDVGGYARSRSQVEPPGARGASALSPWIRHGLLPLPRVWAHVAGGPGQDVRRFRDELLWQEYARHLYARLGPALAKPLRYEQVQVADPWAGDPVPREMACLAAVRDELDADGWLVNQSRLWVAGQWVARAGADWREGEDWLYRRLIDGSRAANRLGWQWAAGTGSGKPYGFSRWQVEKRAPGLCRRCPLEAACPVREWPALPDPVPVDAPDPLLRSDPDPEMTGGPRVPRVDGDPAAVWLHAESLGSDDPALAAHPGLPAVFVFDEPLLRRLRLAGRRLVFLAETLAVLADERPLLVRRGAVGAELAVVGPVATTFAPVPGWRRKAARVRPAVVHPWPWLRRPHGGPIASYSSWVRRAG